MKRALFKFGHHFAVRSATQDDEWAVDVLVPEWETQKGWKFPWANFQPDTNISKTSPGTEIIVTEQRHYAKITNRQHAGKSQRLRQWTFQGAQLDHF